MRQVARRDRGGHDTPDMGGEEGEGFSGTTVQTPATGSGEDWREEAQGGRNGERDGESRSGKKEGRMVEVSEERGEEGDGGGVKGRGSVRRERRKKEGEGVKVGRRGEGWRG